MTGEAMPIRTYVLVFVGLVALTFVTTWLAGADYGWLNIFFAMTIAVAKALLVVLYFMHLLHSPKIYWIFAGAGVVWLAILIVLTMADFDTRIPAAGW